ncbi:MAG TPA: hypothetical protein VLF19_07165 [Methylomirabilota bacterium]|nr:hypothetical protein [Methylomirabilota bacterium]
MNRVAGWSVVAAVMAVSLGAGPAMAEPAMLKQAKDAGLPAQNCQYCHTTKIPKKETFKPEELTDRGKWLRAQKEKRKAPKAEAAWLKEYPGGPAQK